MAKGDKKKMQTQADEARNRNIQMQDTIQSQAITPEFSRNQAFYAQTGQEAINDYRNLMNQYDEMYKSGVGRNTPGLERVNYERTPELNESFQNYRNFAQTGGFSPQDIQDMRARGVSPIRTAYANAMNDMERRKNLAGGYAPNMIAAQARMTGQRGQMMADAVQDVNARLAEQVQKGKMFGTEGFGGLSVRDLELAQNAQLANQRAGIEIARDNLMDPRMAALHGKTQLFGTTPGMANMFGNNTNESVRNWLANNAMGQQAGRDQMAAQQMVAQTPSNFETGFNRVGQGLQMGGQIAGGLMGVPWGGKPPIPTSTGPTGAMMQGAQRNIGSGLYGGPAGIASQGASRNMIPGYTGYYPVSGWGF